MPFTLRAESRRGGVLPERALSRRRTRLLGGEGPERSGDVQMKAKGSALFRFVSHLPEEGWQPQKPRVLLRALLPEAVSDGAARWEGPHAAGAKRNAAPAAL